MPAWLILSWALTLGWVPNQSAFGRPLSDPTQRVFEQTFALQAKIGDHVLLATELETREVPDTLLGWEPFQARYRIRAEALWGFVTVGLKHECIHPVTSADYTNALLTDETEIYMRIASGF